MSLFPVYATEATKENITKDSADTLTEYEIDWREKRLTGRVVKGLDAIKIWILLALRTPRYRYLIYTWDYGSELEDLIGKGYSMEYLEAETRRMVEECLQVHDQIGKVVDFSVKLNCDQLDISFTVETDYGLLAIQENEKLIRGKVCMR